MSIPQDTDLRVTLTLTMPGLTIAQNVFYARYTGATALTEDNVTEDLKIWMLALLADVEDDIYTGVSVNSVSVAKAIPGVPVTWETIGEKFPAWAGLNVSQMLPNGVAAVVRVLSTVAGTVARKYIPGFTEVGSDSIDWIASVLFDLALYVITWYTGPTLGGRTYDAGVWSTLTDSFVALITEGAVSAIPGYQRRRKPGVGA